MDTVGFKLGKEFKPWPNYFHSFAFVLKRGNGCVGLLMCEKTCQKGQLTMYTIKTVLPGGNMLVVIWHLQRIAFTVLN